MRVSRGGPLRGLCHRSPTTSAPRAVSPQTPATRRRAGTDPKRGILVARQRQHPGAIPTTTPSIQHKAFVLERRSAEVQQQAQSVAAQREIVQYLRLLGGASQR